MPAVGGDEVIYKTRLHTAIVADSETVNDSVV